MVAETIYTIVLEDPYGWLIVGSLSIVVAGVLFFDWLDHRGE